MKGIQNKTLKTFIIGSVTTFLAVFLGYCNTGEGNFTVKMTDKPIDDKLGKVVENVNVTITEISVKKKGGKDEIEDDETRESADKDGFVTILTEEKDVDLMTILNGKTTDLVKADLEAGDYGEIRIVVKEDNTIKFEDDDTLYDLKIPSGTSSGIKIKTAFSVTDEGASSLTLDFDAAESVSEKSNEYKLSPVIKVKK